MVSSIAPLHLTLKVQNQGISAFEGLNSNRKSYGEYSLSLNLTMSDLESYIQGSTFLTPQIS